MKDILKALESNEVQLEINVDVSLGWRLPPKDTEERMQRHEINRALAKIGKELEQAIKAKVLEAIEDKRESKS